MKHKLTKRTLWTLLIKATYGSIKLDGRKSITTTLRRLALALNEEQARIIGLQYAEFNMPKRCPVVFVVLSADVGDVVNTGIEVII
jgi:hypothetical protein